MSSYVNQTNKKALTIRTLLFHSSQPPKSSILPPFSDQLVYLGRLVLIILPPSSLHLFKCLHCLPLLLKVLKVMHVLQAKVVPIDGPLIEIESPYLANMPLRYGQLLIVLPNVQLLLDWQQVLHSVEVVFQVVEDASDVENGDGALSVVFGLGLAAPVVLEEQQVVVQCFKAFI